MRIKSMKQQYIDFSSESSLKVVNEYREKYNLLSQLLDKNSQVVSLVHQDLAKMLSQSSKGRKSGYTSEQIREQVILARNIQSERFGGDKRLTNAYMTHKQIEKFCRLDVLGEAMLKNAMSELALSARAHDKICKVARTIADLEGFEQVCSEHISEAITYRKLDRKL